MVITSRFEEIVLYAIYVDFCQREVFNSRKKNKIAKLGLNYRNGAKAKGANRSKSQ